SIFIASMMQSRSPSSTACPGSTTTFHMFPCSGDSSRSGPPAPPDLRSLRAGLRAAAGAGPAAAPPADDPPRTLMPYRPPPPCDLDRVVVLGGLAVALDARHLDLRALQPGLVLDEVAARLGVRPLLCPQQRVVERDQRRQALDLVLAERAQHALRRLLAVDV